MGKEVTRLQGTICWDSTTAGRCYCPRFRHQRIARKEDCQRKDIDFHPETGVIARTLPCFRDHHEARILRLIERRQETKNLRFLECHQEILLANHREKRSLDKNQRSSVGSQNSENEQTESSTSQRILLGKNSARNTFIRSCSLRIK